MENLVKSILLFLLRKDTSFNMKRTFAVVVMGEIGRGATLSLCREGSTVDLVILDGKTLEELKSVLAKSTVAVKQLDYELKALESMTAVFDDLRPKKPRYNPKTGKTKYF